MGPPPPPKSIINSTTELILTRNRCLGSLKVLKFSLWPRTGLYFSMVSLKMWRLLGDVRNVSPKMSSLLKIFCGFFHLCILSRLKNSFMRVIKRCTVTNVTQQMPSRCTICLIIHRKKRFTSFPSPAGMSLTKLPLGRNNSVMTSLFPPRESLVVTSRLGTGNSRTFFLRCMRRYRGGGGRKLCWTFLN